MATKYETFKESFGKYSMFRNGAAKAYNGQDSPAIRDLTASLFEDDDRAQNYFRGSPDPTIPRANINAIYGALNIGSEMKKTALKTYVNSNLEGILKSSPKKDIMLGLNIMPLKKTYTGANADKYRDMAKYFKTSKEIGQAISSDDYGKMIDMTKEHYKKKYSKKKDADKLELIGALITLDPGFSKYMCNIRFNETNAKLEPLVNKYGAKFLMANLKKKEDYIDLYEQMLEVKQRAQH